MTPKPYWGRRKKTFTQNMINQSELLNIAMELSDEDIMNRIFISS
jgi:hypothetical protein